MIEVAANGMGGRTDDPVGLVVAPITHAAAPIALSTMLFGTTQIVLPGFDADTVLRTIEAHRVTHMYLPPTALYGCLARAVPQGRVGTARDAAEVAVFLLSDAARTSRGRRSRSMAGYWGRCGWG